MANYSKTANDGIEYVRGASEAPRVHGLTGSYWGKLPRFKNQFFVGFKYSDLSTTPADIKEHAELSYKVRSIDAPRFEIETETLNQYNKPRTVPTKINYQPINIVFWDDRSNLIKDFWDQNYKFYFRDSIGKSDANYIQTVPDKIVDIKLGVGVTRPAYENFGYNMANKLERKNLFAYLSLYLTAGGQFLRTDIVNPFLQSMQNDNFSQESSGELAQITTTWAYEAIVYYDAGRIEDEQPLVALLDNSIFNRAGNLEVEQVDQESPKLRPNVDTFGGATGFHGGAGAAGTGAVDTLSAFSGGPGAVETRAVDDFTQTEQNSVAIGPQEANVAIRRAIAKKTGVSKSNTANVDEEIIRMIVSGEIVPEEKEGNDFSANLPNSRRHDHSHHTHTTVDQIQREAAESKPVVNQQSAVAKNLKEVKDAIVEKEKLKPDTDALGWTAADHERGWMLDTRGKPGYGPHKAWVNGKFLQKILATDPNDPNPRTAGYIAYNIDGRQVSAVDFVKSGGELHHSDLTLETAKYG